MIAIATPGQIHKDALTDAGLDGDLFKVHGRDLTGPCPICMGKHRFAIFIDKSTGQDRYACRVCGFYGPLSRLKINLQKVRALKVFEAPRDTMKDPAQIGT